MILAPIAIFSYNRAWHLQQTVESLKMNQNAAGSEVFFFCDGAKSETDRMQVQEVRTYVRNVKGFKNVTVIERDKNLGLSRSIIEGVTEVVNKYGRIIVLEDDMVTSPYFLDYMNVALDYYESEEQVISIHGYIYPVRSSVPETFFLKGADCWGWATWKRGWDLFEADGRKLLDELKSRKLTHEFDLNGSYAYTRMLQDQIRGRNNSWAVRWHASAFLQNKLTLYPGRSLVRNIGLDASGTHCSTTDVFSVSLSATPIAVRQIALQEDAALKAAFARFLKGASSPVRNLLRAARSRIPKLFGSEKS